MIGDSTFFVTLHREQKRHKPGPAHALLAAMGDEEIAMSAITRGELARGFYDHAQWQAFCAPFKTYEINDAVFWQAAETYRYLRDQGIFTGENDLWIAATALATGQVLITNNTKNFSKIPRLKIQSH